MAASSTVGSLLGSMRISDAIANSLSRALPSLSAATPTIDISSYVESSLKTGAELDGMSANGLMFRELTTILSTDRLLEVLRPTPAKHANDDVAVSAGLVAAFDDAVSIRRQTGGKDDFIGARHVLAAILTSGDEDVRREFSMARRLASLSPGRPPSTRAIAWVSVSRREVRRA